MRVTIYTNEINRAVWMIREAKQLGIIEDPDVLNVKWTAMCDVIKHLAMKDEEIASEDLTLIYNSIASCTRQLAKYIHRGERI